MSTRRIRVAQACGCPKCGNTHLFTARAQQVSEDCCEIWVECTQCGYDPFHDYDGVDGCTGYCVEDVWGELSVGTITMAVDSWNDLIETLNKERNSK